MLAEGESLDPDALEQREAAKAKYQEWLKSPEGMLATRAQQLSGDYGYTTKVDPKNVMAIQGIIEQLGGKESGPINAIASTLVERYGVTNLGQLGTRQVQGGDGQPVTEYYNKATNQSIPQQFASYDDGKGTYHIGFNPGSETGVGFKLDNYNPRAKGFFQEGIGSALLNLASIIPSPIQPFAVAAKVGMAVDQGNFGQAALALLPYGLEAAAAGADVVGSDWATAGAGTGNATLPADVAAGLSATKAGQAFTNLTGGAATGLAADVAGGATMGAINAALTDRDIPKFAALGGFSVLAASAGQAVFNATGSRAFASAVTASLTTLAQTGDIEKAITAGGAAGVNSLVNQTVTNATGSPIAGQIAQMGAASAISGKPLTINDLAPLGTQLVNSPQFKQATQTSTAAQTADSGGTGDTGADAILTASNAVGQNLTGTDGLTQLAAADLGTRTDASANAAPTSAVSAFPTSNKNITTGVQTGAGVPLTDSQGNVVNSDLKDDDVLRSWKSTSEVDPTGQGFNQLALQPYAIAGPTATSNYENQLPVGYRFVTHADENGETPFTTIKINGINYAITSPNIEADKSVTNALLPKYIPPDSQQADAAATGDASTLRASDIFAGNTDATSGNATGARTGASAGTPQLTAEQVAALTVANTTGLLAGDLGAGAAPGNTTGNQPGSVTGSLTGNTTGGNAANGQLTPEQIAALTSVANNNNLLATDLLGSTTTTKPSTSPVNSLVTSQLGAGSTGATGLNTSQIGALTTTPTGSLNTTPTGSLNTSQIGTLTSGQITALTTTPTGGLTTTPTGGLNTSQITALTTTPIGGLPPWTSPIPVTPTYTMPTLPTSVIATLTSAPVSLPTTQITALTSAPVSLPTTQLTSIIPALTSGLSTLTSTQITALTSTQTPAATTGTATLTSTQIGALTTVSPMGLETLPTSDPRFWRQTGAKGTGGKGGVRFFDWYDTPENRTMAPATMASTTIPAITSQQAEAMVSPAKRYFNQATNRYYTDPTGQWTPPAGWTQTTFKDGGDVNTKHFDEGDYIDTGGYDTSGYGGVNYDLSNAYDLFGGDGSAPSDLSGGYDWAYGDESAREEDVNSYLRGLPSENASYGGKDLTGQYQKDIKDAAITGSSTKPISNPFKQLADAAKNNPNLTKALMAAGLGGLLGYLGRPKGITPMGMQGLGLSQGQVYGALKGTPIKRAEGGEINEYAGGGGLHYLKSAEDGMADKIPATIDNKQPAKLSGGEFVIPADVVSHLGNGNSEAGAKQLYDMMDRIRHARTGTKQQGKQINPAKFTPK